MAEYSMSDAASMIGRYRSTRDEDRLYIEVGDNCVVVNKSLKIRQVIPGNILILEDEFHSAYECKECKGKGEKTITCLKCEGVGRVITERPDSGAIITENCGRCDGKGARTERCDACKGKGALLEIPDSAKNRPTSGRIVSMGPDCHIYSLGDRIAYSGYTGHLLPFKGNSRLRVMAEKEAFVLLEDVAGAAKEEMPEFIDTDSAYITT